MIMVQCFIFNCLKAYLITILDLTSPHIYPSAILINLNENNLSEESKLQPVECTSFQDEDSQETGNNRKEM